MDKMTAVLLLMGITIVALLAYGATHPQTTEKTGIQTLSIDAPKAIALNQHFSITINHVQVNTTYEIQFKSILAQYITQQTFKATGKNYQTVLMATSNYNFNHTLQIVIFRPDDFSYVGYKTITIVG